MIETKAKWCKIGEYQTLVDREDVSVIEAGGWWWGGRYFRGRLGLLHRVIAQRAFGNIPKDRVVDHINRNAMDNRRCNLRLVRQSENVRNSNGKERHRQSKYRGVFPTKSGRWCAQITIEGNRKCLGTFDTELAAAAAYCHAENIGCGLAGKP